MRYVLLSLLVLLPATVTAQEASLRGAWRVATVESGGKPSDAFSVTETIDGGAAEVHLLDSLVFDDRVLTLFVGRHRMTSTTSPLPAGDRGTLKIRLLGRNRIASWAIKRERLVLTIDDPDGRPIVITADRVDD